MANTNPKNSWQNPWSDDHPEKIADKPQTVGFGKQLKNLVNPSGMLDQLFGSNNKTERAPFFKKAEKTPSKRETTVFSFRTHEEEFQVREETKMLLKQLKDQVALLEKSEKALTSQISKIKVEQLPSKTGIYYLRFFEWLINLVKQLRLKADEGRAWLSTFSSRKKKRLGYWQMYKKHGTTFGMSHERSMATQTG